MDWEDLGRLANEELTCQKPIRLRCCTATGCRANGAEAVFKAVQQTIADQNLGDRCEAVSVGCLGLCGAGPLVQCDPSDRLYSDIRPDQAADLVAAAQGAAMDLPEVDQAQPFFSQQLKIVNRHSGLINPDRLESYLAAGGYRALMHTIFDLTPTEVAEIIRLSGLRGRGGGGYPTGLKWATVAKMPSDRKFVVCNGDEGDPGAFMDRSVLESDPHQVIEGMAIAAYAVGANFGYLYVRAEYPLAIARLNQAIRQARRRGLLGNSVLDSRFSFDLEVRIGAGAFVCGEETALIHSIQGERGVPRVRPPYPAESGLWGHPTLINNVETFANIAPIVEQSADWFAAIGTPTSKGTKVFALTGKLRNNGLIEVPMGIPLRSIVDGMGIPESPVKAVQTGGPSGGCIPLAQLDTPVDYDSLIQLGSMMGSGGMVVMDENTDMVAIARFYMEFCRSESCGKCIPCRAGTVQLHELLGKLSSGQGTAIDLQQLEDLCYLVKDTSLCGLGMSAPNPILSTLRWFRQEYESRLIPERAIALTH
ncbi:NADH dehydrogenase I chain F [Synechococcus elongatus PCC 6301]|uniref:NADH dehydrogenase I chain F n=1 Tax=Synechococcus sp. (strain ATCC 27144 / PCC 6301 / SAUG 1402/1) TaxID=269084 RepID=A0A0H3K5I9_SYNP6|nr:NADH-ubiquinone oxidoreductase-F iron-sulfur binding region domain-containing protein [Synechococcus elongatus]BAD79424.1 NADH dehydrogenase I chain F [Synechococcus elongatus PCC 6301]